MESKQHVTIHWFRHGLRLHDNPALLNAIDTSRKLYHVFIFDGEVAGTQLCGYNRWRFLHESLQDLDRSLQKVGSRLYVLQGDSADTVFEQLFQEWGITKLTFEQDPEPIWHQRDQKVKDLCEKLNIEVAERISHTLYDPKLIIETNGNMPPLTYRTFVTIMEIIGAPNEPCEDPDYSDIDVPVLENYEDLYALPNLKQLGVAFDFPEQENRINKWNGGETSGLELLDSRIDNERRAFAKGIKMVNQTTPDLLGPPLSLSPYLRFGALSIRLFYSRLYTAHNEVTPGNSFPETVLSQLIWREFFYVMSVNNPTYAQMTKNPICLNIDWYDKKDQLKKWEMGETGYPWIDACMKQLRKEGWLHHVARNAVACFLTRGDLWISWVDGLQVFLKYLLDADWSVCAGNWMWVSSSAFEDCLQCPMCFSPVSYGIQMDKSGEYIRRYVPALRDMPLKYLFCPWKAPLAVQQQANCVIGKDYPSPIVDHAKAWKECKQKMVSVKEKLRDPKILHITPSDVAELRKFFCLPEEKVGRCTADDLCHVIANASIDDM